MKWVLILLVLLCLVPAVSAEWNSTKESHELVYTYMGNDIASRTGLTIFPNRDVVLNNITLNGNDTADPSDRCRVTEDTNATLKEIGVRSGNYVFFTQTNFTLGHHYHIDCYAADGLNRVLWGNRDVSLPRNRSNINFFAGSLNSVADTGEVNVIMDIATSYIAGPPPETHTYFALNASNLYNSSYMLPFTAYISNATDSFILETTNGTVKLTDITGLYNLTVASSRYVNVSYSGWNISSDLNAKMYQAVAYVYATEFITNYSLSNFSVYPGKGYNSTTGSYLTLFLSEGLFNFTYADSRHANQTTNFSFTYLDNRSVTISNVYVGLFNITASVFNTSTITSFTIQLTGLSHTFAGNYSTTNGSLFIPVINGSYNLLIDAYPYERKNVTIAYTSGLYNYSFSLYLMNSFFFYFRDLETKALIANVTLDMISTPFAWNYTTPTGILNVSLIVPASYEFRYSAPGYAEAFYYFTLVNGSVNNITLYMTNNDTMAVVTATVYDQIGNTIENVVIKALKYDIATNSYILAEMATTNFEGVTQLHLILNTEFYKFLLEYPAGTLRKETTPSYIYSSTLAFQILTEEEVGYNYEHYQNLSYELSFNPTTLNYRFTWSDSNNILEQICLKVWRITSSGETLLNTSCSSSAAGTIIIPIVNITPSTYKASAYAYFDSEPYLLSSLLHEFREADSQGLLAMFLVGILTIFFFSVGFWKPVIACILTPLPVLIASISGMIPIPLAISVPLEVVGLILAYVISSRS